MKRAFQIAFCLLIYTSLHAQIKLPQLIRDSMILQRDAKINIWGWASNKEKITIKFNGENYSTIPNNNGEWKLQLAPQHAGGPYTMEISGKNKIVLHDLLIGDVWVCAGQSNMEHQMKLHNIRYADEIANANYPEIRQFKVANITNLISPQKDLPNGSWKFADSINIKDFSAVAYFFAKALYQKYHVPIGIINASWGGIPIEAMMSEESLKDFPNIISTVEKDKDTAYVNDINRKAFLATQAMPQPNDEGINQKWFDTTYQPKEWKRIAVPGYWQNQSVKDLNGIVWYRKEIDIPASMINQTAKIFLGRIVDADEVYINGVKVGSTVYLYPQRKYYISANILKPGKNLIVVRVTNFNGNGGFVPDKPYGLVTGNDTISLVGYWQYKVGAVFTPYDVPKTIVLQNQPTALYNSMIAPLTNYTIKGFTWYQGESNTSRADEYAKLQPAMINDWRSKWNDNRLPFLFVQLPGFMDYTYSSVESEWANFREAQARSLTVNNTAMAVAIDIGEWNDIHPDDKKDVGDRLALAAEKIAYSENIIYSGPTFQSQKIEGNKIILLFTNVGSGLSTNDDEPLTEFAIAGDDKKFMWAKAKIEDSTIIVWSDAIASPKYVRYAWADDPPHPNLINKEGLPAAPFRTDE